MEKTGHRLKWYTAGGGFIRMGPFKSQKEAWAAMQLTDAEKTKQCSIHPKDTRVWPE